MVSFSNPGEDGALPTGALEWRRALVYTGKFGNPDSFDCAAGYRIAVSFKELVGPEEEVAGFNDIYDRITAIARARINQLTCACGERPHVGIRRQGWCRFGATCDIAIAFALWELACAKEDGQLVSEPTPTAEDLSKPREATPEVSPPFSLENADEIYNTVDFARDSSPNVEMLG